MQSHTVNYKTRKAKLKRLVLDIFWTHSLIMHLLLWMIWWMQALWCIAHRMRAKLVCLLEVLRSCLHESENYFRKNANDLGLSATSIAKTPSSITKVSLPRIALWDVFGGSMPADGFVGCLNNIILKATWFSPKVDAESSQQIWCDYSGGRSSAGS